MYRVTIIALGWLVQLPSIVVLPRAVYINARIRVSYPSSPDVCAARLKSHSLTDENLQVKKRRGHFSEQ